MPLKSLKQGTDPEIVRLWSMPRLEVESLYDEVFERNDRAEVRWFARNDRYFLLTCILRRPDVRDDFLFDRIREVEADPDDYIDVWAREHYKSTIISFAGNIQDILVDPEITIGIFSHNRPIAKDFLKQIKLEFEENAFLRELFPDIFWDRPDRQAPRWGEEAGIVVRRNTNPREATVEAWGLVDGQPIGKHFRKLVYDDVVTDKSVGTPDMIKKTTASFDLSRYLGVRRGGRKQIVGTRYHFADTYGQLLKRGLLKERRYPATDTGKFDGKPIFLTQKQWDEELRQPKGVVAAQMLCNPIEGAETKFDPRLLQFWTVRPKVLNVYILCDPSKGRSATSDNTAIAVIGLDVGRNKYLLDGWCHRMTLSKRWQVVRDAYRRWSRMQGIGVVEVGYEQFGMQTDIEYFEERMTHEGIHFPITEVNWPRSGPKSKIQRIERMEPDVRMGRFRLPNVFTVEADGTMTPYDPKGTNAAREAIEKQEAWRVARSIHKIDEDDHVYDYLAKFMEEFVFFPAGMDDILDSISRMYDMKANPPQSYDESPFGDNPLEPEVFADGV